MLSSPHECRSPQVLGPGGVLRLGRYPRRSLRVRRLPARHRGRRYRRPFRPHAKRPCRPAHQAAGQRKPTPRSGCGRRNRRHRHSLSRCPGDLLALRSLVAMTIPGVVVVFEVLSSNTSRTDRIIKVHEYAAIPSIRRYVIVETTGIGLTVMERERPDEAWRVGILTGDEILR